MANTDAWEELDAFRMNQQEIDDLIMEAPGCAVCWTRRDGHPVGVWVSHVVMDGEVYVTTTDNRPKTKSWRRDGRVAAVFGIPGKGAVTILGRVELSDDATLRRRFLEALATRLGYSGKQRDLWFLHMDTAGRVTGHILPEKYITFDERKLVWE